MQSAIVVGQDTSNNCLVATFNGETEVWSVDTSFPTINGVLFGVYSVNQSDVWVCGGTGNDGKTSPILYHYVGRSTWVDYSSQLTDCTYLSKIDGSGTNNIWCVGDCNDGIVYCGAWQWDGSSWTSTRQNTVDLATLTPSNGLLSLSVSSNGTCYIPKIQSSTTSYCRYLLSNKTDVGFSVFKDFGTYEIARVKAFSDDAIVCCQPFSEGAQSYAFNRYISGAWNRVGRRPTNQGSGSYNFDGTNAYHLVWTDTISGLSTYQLNDTYTTDGLAISSGPIGLGSFSTNAYYGFLYLADDDIWYFATDISSPYTPQLRHWEGGTTWSVTSDDTYGESYVTLGAKSWYDISANINPPPYFISGPTCPNPGYYTNFPMTWKLGQD